MEATDVVAIEQVLARYGHVADGQEWDRLEEVFTEDCVLDASAIGEPRLVGLKKLAAWFDGSEHPSSHNTTNVHVTERDGEVRVQSKYLAPWPNGTLETGDYEDLAVRTPTGWRIAHRVVRPR